MLVGISERDVLEGGPRRRQVRRRHDAGAGGVAGVLGPVRTSTVWPPAGWSAAAARRSASLGARVLADGGNAIDATLAMTAMSWLALPGQCGIGGDAFAVVREPDGRVWTVNGSGFGPDGGTPGGLPRPRLTRLPLDRRAGGGGPRCDRRAGHPARRGGTRSPSPSCGSRPPRRPASGAAVHRQEPPRHRTSTPTRCRATRTWPSGCCPPGGSRRRWATCCVSADLARQHRAAGPPTAGWFYRGEFAERAVALLRAGGAPFSGDEWVLAATCRRSRAISAPYGGVDRPPDAAAHAGLDGAAAGRAAATACCGLHHGWAPTRSHLLARPRASAFRGPLRALCVRQRRRGAELLAPTRLPSAASDLARSAVANRSASPCSPATPRRPSPWTPTAARSASSTPWRSRSARGSPSRAPASCSTTGWAAAPT